jgi:hypothetical protein
MLKPAPTYLTVSAIWYTASFAPLIIPIAIQPQRISIDIDTRQLRFIFKPLQQSAQTTDMSWLWILKGAIYPRCCGWGQNRKQKGKLPRSASSNAHPGLRVRNQPSHGFAGTLCRRYELIELRRFFSEPIITIGFNSYASCFPSRIDRGR